MTVTPYSELKPLKNERCAACNRDLVTEWIHWTHVVGADVTEEWYCSMACFLRARAIMPPVHIDNWENEGGS